MLVFFQGLCGRDSPMCFRVRNRLSSDASRSITNRIRQVKSIERMTTAMMKGVRKGERDKIKCKKKKKKRGNAGCTYTCYSENVRLEAKA